MSSFVSSFLDLTLGSNLVILYNSEMPKMLMKELTDECELKRGGSFKSKASTIMAAPTTATAQALTSQSFIPLQTKTTNRSIKFALLTF